MKKLLIILALSPLLSFGQTNIELESHNYMHKGLIRSGCYFGVSDYDQGVATMILKLTRIVRVEVVYGNHKEAYTISSDGIYDISLALPSDNFTIIFTDCQGVRLWWYRY